MEEEIGKLVTEGRNPDTIDIDIRPTLEILDLINREDHKVPEAVRTELPQIAKVVDSVVEGMKAGGRLFYAGAGTSGRIGVLDASECPPTYGTDPQQVQAILAGGIEAFTRAAEGLEDDPEAGARAVRERSVGPNDVLLGIAASGRTPFVIGAMEEARRRGATVAALVCNPDSRMAEIADVVIAPVVGPEVIMGSTRMKAGTAQKLVLNMITTAVMIRLGKTYSNLMVDLRATNEKLENRAARIVALAAGVEMEEARTALQDAGGKAKVAIVMLRTGVRKAEAERLLERADGYVRKAEELEGRNRCCE